MCVSHIAFKQENYFFNEICNTKYTFCKIYQLKGLKPKNKGHANFYECCDLTKKSISNLYITLPDVEGRV